MTQKGSKTTKACLPMFCAVLMLAFGVVGIQAQQEKEKWQRVFKSEAFVTDINKSSLRLGPEKVLQIQSRTVVSDPVTLSGSSGPKYKSTLQTVEFKLGEGQYRILDTVFLDASGKVLLETVGTPTGWRVIKEGGAMANVLEAASVMQPFGSWKITTYRYVEGNETQPSRELENLVGKPAEFCFECAEVASRVCPSALFQDQRYTKEEFAGKSGFELKAVGVNADAIETIEVKCVRGEWPAQSLLLKVGEHEMLMLWDGVFLVLKRERHWIGTSPPKNRSKPEFKVPQR